MINLFLYRISSVADLIQKLDEYVTALINFRLSEFDQQCSAIRFR